MVKILEMKFIRYANLFNKIMKTKSKHCFEYNNSIVFTIPKNQIMKITKNKSFILKLKKLNELLGKRIKIVPYPNGKEDIENFVSVLVNPVQFKLITVEENKAVINATSQNKASLIGRKKTRLEEMQNILRQYFGIKKLRIK